MADPYQPQNTTAYVHPRDPNLNRIENAMEYSDGVNPHLRVSLGSDTITITGDVNLVDKVKLWDGTNTLLFDLPNNDTETAPWSLPTESHNMVFNGSTWDRMRGNINDGVLVKLSNNTVDIGSNGTVSLSADTLSQLETITVNQGTAGSTPWKVDIGTNGTVTINQPVAVTQHANSTPWQISKNSAANSATNRIFVSMETDAVLADSNYFFNVARGLVDTHTPVLRSAFIPSTPNSETSVWVEGGLYPYASWTSASTLYIASDSAADTSLSIFIEGLDSNYVYQSETVTTNASNGTTTITTTKQYLRIYKGTITNNNANSPNAGEIRFRITSASGTVVAHIGAGIGVTKLSQYTIPAGFTGYLLYGDVSSFKSGQGNQGCRVKMMVRPYQMSFVTAFIAVTSNGLYRHDFTVPMKITEKSDIDVRVLTDSTGASVSASYEMILIPN